MEPETIIPRAKIEIVGAEPELRLYTGNMYRILNRAEIRQFIESFVRFYPDLVIDIQQEQMRYRNLHNLYGTPAPAQEDVSLRTK